MKSTLPKPRLTRVKKDYQLNKNIVTKIHGRIHTHTLKHIYTLSLSHTDTHTHTYIYIYIYIQRERERGTHTNKQKHINTQT